MHIPYEISKFRCTVAIASCYQISCSNALYVDELDSETELDHWYNACSDR